MVVVVVVLLVVLLEVFYCNSVYRDYMNYSEGNCSCIAVVQYRVPLVAGGVGVAAVELGRNGKEGAKPLLGVLTPQA